VWSHIGGEHSGRKGAKFIFEQGNGVVGHFVGWFGLASHSDTAFAKQLN
jgi:hypothetical protein